MKNVLLFLGLFASFLSFAQTPFTHYFGESGRISIVRDFTRSSAGNYLLHAYGNYAGQTDYDLLTYQYSVANGLQDSTIAVRSGTQILHSVHEDGSGGAVICADARQPDQTTQDILLQYVDEDGNETDARYFGSEFEDDIRVAAMDEQQNVFVAYRQAASLYPRSASMRLLSVDADKELAYDVAIEIENGGFLDLIPLGNGEVVVIAYANIAGQNRSEVIKVATDGSIAWQKQFTNAEDGVQYLTAGLYHEGVLYLADYIGYKFITLDVANGNLSGALTFPNTVPFNVFSPFVIYQDALWILSTASVSQLIENSSGYELANSYEVDEDRIENARLRATGQWEYLNNEGQLKSFDLTTAQFSTLAEVEFTEFVPSSEETCNVILDEGELITGVRRYRVGEVEAIVNRFSENANLVSSVAGQTFTPFNRTAQILALPGGKAAILRVVSNENQLKELWIDFADETGEVVSEYMLVGPSSLSISISKMLLFADGTIGIHVNLRDFGDYSNLIFNLDPENPNTDPVQTINNNTPYNRFASSENGDIVLMSLSYINNEPLLRIRKSTLNGGSVWETTTTFPDLQEVRSYSSSHIALSDAPSGEVLTGSNLQAGSQVPVYYLKLFDALGENVTNFTSVNTQLSAFAHFLNDEQIIVIGCGLNSASTGPDDLYLLNYEIYDLSGNLVTEITNTLPYEISLSGIENLGDGLVAVYGRVYQNDDTDALVMVINEAGEITEVISNSLSLWGELTIGPNPSRDLLRIQLENDYQGEVAINAYTTEGRLIGNWKTDKLSDQMTWEISLIDVPAGSYWVQVKSPEGQVTAAWVKQ